MESGDNVIETAGEAQGALDDARKWGQDVGGAIFRRVYEAGREKTWDELTPDERIERLRDCLRSKDMAIQDLREQISRLMNHSHGRNGELLGPLYSFPGQQAMCRGGHDPLA